MDSSPDALEALILSSTETSEIADTWPFAATHKVEHNSILGVVNSLTAESYVVTEQLSVEFMELTSEASSYVSSGSPEVQVFRAVPVGAGADEATLRTALGDELVKIGLGKCMKNKWVARDKATGAYSRLVEAVERDELVEQLIGVRDGGAAASDAALIKELKKRQLVVLVCVCVVCCSACAFSWTADALMRASLLNDPPNLSSPPAPSPLSGNGRRSVCSAGRSGRPCVPASLRS